MSSIPVLSVRKLTTCFYSQKNRFIAVNNIDIDLYAGKITALIGGSGSGKSATALSLINLIDNPGKVVSGEITLFGEMISNNSERQWRKIRGSKIAMIFQEPRSALNPTIKIEKHFAEALSPELRKKCKTEKRQLYKEILSRLGLSHGDELLNKYPFELSGGMCQRIMVGMGLLSGAKVLIADEPTASLDLTTQAAILYEIDRLKALGIAILLITHDLGVVAQMADDVYVMYQGNIVESGSVTGLFDNPQHEYTQRLLATVIAGENNAIG